MSGSAASVRIGAGMTEPAGMAHEPRGVDPKGQLEDGGENVPAGTTDRAACTSRNKRHERPYLTQADEGTDGAIELRSDRQEEKLQSDHLLQQGLFSADHVVEAHALAHRHAKGWKGIGRNHVTIIVPSLAASGCSWLIVMRGAVSGLCANAPPDHAAVRLMWRACIARQPTRCAASSDFGCIGEVPGRGALDARRDTHAGCGVEPC